MASGGIKIRFEAKGTKISDKLVTRSKAFNNKRIKAIQSTARQVADEIEYAGRNDIRAGGNFGSERWIMGFRAFVSFKDRVNLNIRVSHAVSYWRVFEFGARIIGKPMLWIPLSFGNSFGVRARDYPGKLFRVNRPGKAPLLMDKNGPQYFGKEAVTIPKKWHLRAVVRRVARRMGKIYKEQMKNV